MQKLKSIAFAITMLIGGTAISSAQEKAHEHGSPHGGTVKTAGDYHIEMVMAKDKMTIYLLDGKEKAIPNKGVTGKATLQFEDKTSVTVDLSTMGNDGFSITNDKINTFTSCVITFKVNGKTATAKFKAEKSAAKTYSCSMHPEITSNKAGKCSKCGMALSEVKKKEEHKHNEGEEHHNH